MFVFLVIEFDKLSKHYLFVQREINIVFQAVIYTEHRNDTSERKGRQVSVKQTRDYDALRRLGRMRILVQINQTVCCVLIHF